jgi:hypothetical protein
MDMLLMAIDIEPVQGHETTVPDQPYRIGVSFLDTRYLQASCDAPAAESELEAMITSSQFTGGASSKYSRKAANRFLFGQSEPVSLSQLKPRLRQMVSCRDVVLVLHGAREDLKVLNSLGVDLHPIFVMDIVKAAQYVIGLSYRYSLEKMLTTLDIAFIHLHTAGNDAHFALRAFLMIIL